MARITSFGFSFFHTDTTSDMLTKDLLPLFETITRSRWMFLCCKREAKTELKYPLGLQQE
jgi:hypothetical protein